MRAITLALTERELRNILLSIAYFKDEVKHREVWQARVNHVTFDDMEGLEELLLEYMPGGIIDVVK